MDKYDIQVELLKGEDPIDLPEDFDGEDITAAVMGAKLALDKGIADNVVFYVAKDGELLNIVTESKDSFDVKEVAVKINQIKEDFNGN